MVVNENVFFPIEGVDVGDATLLLDIMGTGSHALGRARRAREDITSLLVTGAGPIGLGVLAMAKLIFGPGFPVFITDLVPFRLELADRLGGCPSPVREGSLEANLRAHGFTKVDAAIDASGKASARRQALDALARAECWCASGTGKGWTSTSPRISSAPHAAS